MANRRRDIGEKGRGKVTRLRNKVCFIGCEGKTEKNYFDEVNALTPGIQIRTIDGPHSNPSGVLKDLLQTLREYQFNADNGDIAFCVFDTEFDMSKQDEINKTIKNTKAKK